MNERTTLEIIAPTVEEALAQGLSQLGLTADRVSIEVLDTGNKGLFGLGKPQVRVRLTVVPEGGAPVKQTEPAASAPEPKASPARATKASVDRTQDKAVPAIPSLLGKESNPRPDHDPLLDRTETVISKLIHLLHLEAQVSAHYSEQDREGSRNIHVDIRGNDLSVLIGRHSETLNAFQYVASLIVGREVQDWVQLVIDVEGYRDRREKQLIQMAMRMADQVAKSGRRQSLEPMPSGERRVIHIALRDHPEVTTESTGEEPNRKITIVPKNS
ncbi:MAG TPA: RNA-binding cell elongation regulator Jag/EloR [Anaerolineales bacterium]|nr:RNA-binding cell elongation regulator Jag/EloR [Anaerolineales bacterium]